MAKIGQRQFGARASHGHNLAIFHLILTNEYTKMTSSSKRIEWNKKLSSIISKINSLYFGFRAPFLLQVLAWAMYLWTQNYPQIVGTCPGHHGQLISQNCTHKNQGWTPRKSNTLAHKIKSAFSDCKCRMLSAGGSMQVFHASIF